jgi:GNAT superfamily N-acetyltransferase
MTGQAPAAVAEVRAEALARELPEFGALLHACVADGASVGFVLPFRPDEAEAFWRDRVLPPVRGGTRILLAARSGGRVVGTVQLGIDTPANQPHRAEVSKLLVRPDRRRRGVATALMAALEARARRLGRSLLTLDTRTGDAAEPLYAGLGYATVGVVPGYCLEPFGTGRLEATTVMYKAL